MPHVERDLEGWKVSNPALKAGSRVTSLTLESNENAVFRGFSYTLTFPLANAYRILLAGPDRPAPPHDNVVLQCKPLAFEIVSLDDSAKTAILNFPERHAASQDLDGSHGKSRKIKLSWTGSIVSEVWEQDGSGEPYRLMGDLPYRSYALTEHGMIRHWHIERENIHLGMGERGAPIDLSGRSFTNAASDSAFYDAYHSDPLYKHAPFLISAPKGAVDGKLRSTYAIFHASNALSIWDLGKMHDEPWGYFKSFTQDYGGLEEWVMIGKSTREVVRTFAEIAGRPKLVGRDWLGYLASGMGLGESDDPPAQQLLETWPDLCKKYDIPCSAMHLSSGYTVDEKTGYRNVFTMNKKRYPDFKAMVSVFHRAGMKVVPNIKPYILQGHPSYHDLYSDNGLHEDPITGKPVVTRIWAGGILANDKGSWSDQTSRAGRKWWTEGVQSLIDLGCDGMWNDNNEFSLHDDAFIVQNQLAHHVASPIKGPQPIGMMGRLFNTELMAKHSNDTLGKANPERRTYVLSRSGNIGMGKYACSTWSGDNATSWHNLRGSQAIQLNAGLSLMQAYGSDVGGFTGPVPSPELFLRWCQLGVTHARFCIHSAPNKREIVGDKANTPWMFPETLPTIREHIKWRYELMPFLNNLMWDSHLHANPTNAWLGYGDFAQDATLYEDGIIDGFDAWIGCGQLLSCPALEEGMLSREVYFPKASQNDQAAYYDLHAPYAVHVAGSRAIIATPLDHMGLFAREGAILPIGKRQHTVTQIKGPGRTHTDGVDVVLESDGGLVGLDDLRGVYIFPPPPDTQSGATYKGQWIEDDGISAKPDVAIISVEYTATDQEVQVELQWKERKFEPLWGKHVWVVLPVTDERPVQGATVGRWGERIAWKVTVR